MKPVTIEEYVFEKVKKTNVVINIPQEPIFFQEYNHRVIYGLFPQFATWADNSVWEIQVVRISDEAIERTMVRTHSEELSKIVSRFDVKNKSREDFIKEKVVHYLKNHPTEDRVSKETFVSKYNAFLLKISELAGL